MATEVLAEEAWNFVVFRHGDDWVLTYLAGSVGLYEVSIKLSKEEVARIRTTPAFAKSLTEQFRLTHEVGRERELRPAVWPTRK
ncbi:hypothetical protein ABIB38_002330 [Massilia sp. UYP11]|uniref:hypothetical protein n=1 Tax=Massilia sp. UYP11 TaxID=1756385 RepID=UPI003D20BEF0